LRPHADRRPDPPERCENPVIAQADTAIFPIFLCEERPPPEPPRILAFAGTGFQIGPLDLLVTCWHVVEHEPEGHGFAAGFSQPDGTYTMVPVLDVSRDVNGTDMATGRLFEPHPNPDMRLLVGPDTRAAKDPLRVPTMGTDVFTVGYPLTAETRDPITGEKRWELHARLLRGYTTRVFDFDRPGFGPVRSWEIDMPAPEGLSGAPLIMGGTSYVIGVVYGVNEVARIAEYAVDDPATGERRPEVLRIERFALATYTDDFRKLAGTATGGQPLSELMSYGSPA
jgi:hypothetical protein